MGLEDLKIYGQAMNLGEEVWKEVTKWDYFNKDTIGKQVVRSVDSVAANISEGYGRYHFKDSKKFYYYSRGSLYETKTWLTKAKNRNLIEEVKYNKMITDINTLGKMLNKYIQSIGNNMAKEDEAEYGSPNLNTQSTNP